MGLFKRKPKPVTKPAAKKPAPAPTVATQYAQKTRKFDAVIFDTHGELAASEPYVGGRVRFVREPDNFADKNAIGIIGPKTAGVWGYMPREVAARYASSFDKGAKFAGEIVEMLVDGRRVVSVTVQIRLVQ